MKRKTGKTGNSPIGMLMTGLLVSVLVAIGSCMIGAAMIVSETVSESALSYCAAAAILAGTMSGGMVVAAKAGEQKWVLCPAHGIACFAILLFVGMLFFDGAISGVGATGLLSLGGSMGAALFSLKKKGRSGRGRSRYKLPAIVQNAQ